MVGPRSRAEIMSETQARKRLRRERRLAAMASGGASTSAAPPASSADIAAEPEPAELEPGKVLYAEFFPVSLVYILTSVLLCSSADCDC